MEEGDGRVTAWKEDKTNMATKLCCVAESAVERKEGGIRSERGTYMKLVMKE